MSVAVEVRPEHTVSDTTYQREKIIVGLHFYQPERFASHRRLSHISSDPMGENWTATINEQVYQHFARSGLLSLASYTYYPTLEFQLDKLDPETSQAFREYLPTNGIGSPFIHVLLPDLSKEDKRILVAAGRKKSQGRFFWAPESAYDDETLEVLTEMGYQGVICAPEQLTLDDGSFADDTVARIHLPSGNQIHALAFNRSLSKEFAFGNERFNADVFANAHIKWRLNGKPLIEMTDGETFGHHMQWGGMFIEHLLKHSLSGNVMPINDIDLTKSVNGRLRDRTAWSCPHGDLIRWHGECDCHGVMRPDLRWKKPFYEAHCYLNEAVGDLVKIQLGSDYEAIMVEGFEEGYKNPGIWENGDRELALVSAKVSSLASRTSCATFFDSPGTSGWMNLIFAAQAFAHLEEVGLCRRPRRNLVEIKREYMDRLADVPIPFNPGERDLTARTLYQRLAA